MKPLTLPHLPSVNVGSFAWKLRWVHAGWVDSEDGAPRNLSSMEASTKGERESREKTWILQMLSRGGSYCFNYVFIRKILRFIHKHLIPIPFTIPPSLNLSVYSQSLHHPQRRRFFFLREGNLRFKVFSLPSHIHRRETLNEIFYFAPHFPHISISVTHIHSSCFEIWFSLFRFLNPFFRYTRTHTHTLLHTWKHFSHSVRTLNIIKMLWHLMR